MTDTVQFCSGDWDVGSDSLAEELVRVGPGEHDGQRLDIDEVDGDTLVAIHRYEWNGSSRSIR